LLASDDCEEFIDYYSSEEQEKGDLKMNWDEIKGDWKQFQGKVKAKWAKLTDDDMMQIQGKKEELVGKLQKHYGHTKEEAEKHLDEFIAKV